MIRLLPLALPLALISGPVLAEPALPPDEAVMAALDAYPAVQAARARVDAARADARARARGPHELTFSGSYTRRTIDREGEYDEYDAELSRAFRLPGKAALDREIGSFGLEEAENLAEDARHEAALLLLGQWFDWLGAAAQALIDAQAVANYSAALAAVKRREELGDASRLEVDQTEAVLASARIVAEQSTGRALTARARLAAHFPALPLPQEAPALPEPELPAEGLERLRQLVLDRSHVLAAMEARARKAQSAARRSRLDRMADPSLGVRLFSERGGEERGAGLTFSVPIGGGHRAALADQAEAEASAARSEVQLARFELRANADADLLEAQYQFAAWQRAREGLTAQMAALEKLRRGYQLGETDLADLLLAERMVHDALRGEVLARADAQRSIARLKVDSHELWLGD